MNLIETLRDKVLAGGQVTDDELYAIAETEDRQALRDAAAAITARFVRPHFSSCSIINARSGSCSENCKWCAQSAHYNTGCETYPLVSAEECMTTARANADAGVERFSLVASGRSVRGRALDHICHLLRRVHDETGITTCASLGLLDREGMRQLAQSGVTRYHCNLETAPSHFATLCTTHTIEDKLRTIGYAHEAGLDVCSGGILGMGESVRQRAEFALTLRRAQPVSIPVNILIPIPGTPLEDMKAITEDEILDAVAILRFAHPTVEIRFAGGRKNMSRRLQVEAMRIAVNGGIVGDLLTTIGSSVEADKRLAAEAGRPF